jgi:prophage antirepressor-like protein
MTNELIPTTPVRDPPAEKIAVFRKPAATVCQHGEKEIRKTVHKNEWWFSITDIIEALTGNERPHKYWNDLKKKLMKEGYSEMSEKIGQLKLQV